MSACLLLHENFGIKTFTEPNAQKKMQQKCKDFCCTSRLELDAADTTATTCGRDRLETVWKRRKTATATEDRCSWFVQRRDPKARSGRPTTAAGFAAGHRRVRLRPSPRRTWQPHRRRGRPQTRLLSARTSKTRERGGERRLATTPRWHREEGRTWLRGLAARNREDCRPGTDLAPLSTTASTKTYQNCAFKHYPDKNHLAATTTMSNNRLENGQYGHTLIRVFEYTQQPIPIPIRVLLALGSQPLISLDQAGHLENAAYTQSMAHADH